MTFLSEETNQYVIYYITISLTDDYHGNLERKCTTFENMEIKPNCPVDWAISRQCWHNDDYTLSGFIPLSRFRSTRRT